MIKDISHSLSQFSLINQIIVKRRALSSLRLTEKLTLKMSSIDSVELDELNTKTPDEPKKVQKEQWGNEIEFLLSCITLSVGLGNVWR